MEPVKPDRLEPDEHANDEKSANRYPHEEFRLAHCSDLHVICLDHVKVRELLNKRLYGYIAWRLHRHMEHRGEVLAALVDDVRSSRPDHIIVTGDLTHLGLPSQFREACDLLRSLGPPSKVFVIPGNHDAYVATSWESTFRLWSDYMASDGEQPFTGALSDPRGVFPAVRVRGPVALVGVSTALPTLPFLAKGTIGRVQMERLENILEETGRRRLLRVVLMHHPPVSGVVSWRKQLTDQAMFQAVLARHGAELILHGHTHRTSLQYLETPRGRVFCAAPPSASALGRSTRRRSRYHLFRFLRYADRVKLLLSVRAYSRSEQCFVEELEQPVSLPNQ